MLSASKMRNFLPSAGGAGEGKERKEKQLVPRPEALQRLSPFPALAQGDVRHATPSQRD